MSESPRHLSPQDFTALLPSLLPLSAAGIDISGVSGSGKTNAGKLLFLAHVSAGYPAFFFTPHSQDAQALKRMCLELPEHIHRNVITIKPADPSFVVPVNPLRVARTGLSDYEWSARLSNKVGHTARILLASAGEGGLGFASRPLLRKWVTRWLRALAFLNLSVADVRHFIDVSSDVYQGLTRLIPDMMARSEMDEIADVRLSEREEQIASAKNRFLSLLENSVIEAHLGKVEGVLNAADILATGRSIIFDVSKEGMLSDDDQQILANIYLTELIHTLMNLPESKLPEHPCLVCIDELPVFESSAPLLMDACTEIRKFSGRFVFMHQGTCRFAGAEKNEFLNTIVKMCRVHLYFRHVGTDARFFADIFSMPSYDPMREKFRLYTPQQFTEEQRIITLVDESEALAEGETAGGAAKTGTSTNQNWSDATGHSQSTSLSAQEEQLRDVITRTQGEVNSSNASKGGARGKSEEHSSNWSTSTTRTRTRTRKQTILPVLRTRDVLSSVTFFTPDEHDREAAAILAAKDTGQAILHVSGKALFHVTLPLAKDRLKHAPHTLAQLETAYRAHLRALPFFHTPEAVFAERKHFVDVLLRNLREVTDALPDESTAALPPPTMTQPSLFTLSSTNDPEDSPINP